ncbi:MAG: DUF5686 family protein [Bacteroidales bacterium]|nr:DUF5686 family protein [Bacteroidales bacterium]
MAKTYIYPIVLLVLMLSVSALAYGGGSAAIAADGKYFISGIVRDSVDNEPVPMASVSIDGSAAGTLSDIRGVFEMTVPDGTRCLIVNSQGYRRKVVPIRKNRVNVYEIKLAPQAETLGEVVIRKKKYSKKNNPAVDLMERIRATQKVNDPRRNPYYNYDKYERITIGLNNITPNSKGKENAIMKRFPFLWEHVDTSEISGKPILPLSVKETSSQIHCRRSPESQREVITGLKSEGVDEITDQESVRAFLQDVLREIDLYDKDINILQNRFVSPLSPIAADFYKFYITDSMEIDGEKALQLSFYPHNRSVFGFVGQMYVVPSDTAMFIRRVTMRVDPEINLNFIESMYIDQEYERGPDGSRLKTRDDLTMEISVVPGLQGMYARRNVAYDNHNFDRPDDEKDIFGKMAETSIQPQARLRDEEFWRSVRLFELPPAESRISDMLTRLRSNKLYFYGEKFIKLMASGYVATGHDTKFDIGPLNTFVSGNSLEGFRMRLGGMTTGNLSRHWFTRFYVAHGFRDHKWKYGFELEYSFNEKRFHSREFPVHSVRLNSSYDIDQIGQNYLFTNQDNFVLAWKRMEDNRVSYSRLNKLTYTLELENHFSVIAAVANDCQFSSRLLQFAVTDGSASSGIMTQKNIYSFNETWGELTLRYAPGEKFYQTRSHRLPINLDAPVMTLTHRVAPGGAFGNRWHVQRTEASIMKRFWFSAWGYLDVMAKGGHVWSSRTPYTQMFIPNANLSYTVQPESFSLMNAMEFVADSYVQTDLTYWANGAILNYIPYVRKLKLREVFSLRTFWGKLSERNNPRLNGDMLAFPGQDVAVTDVSRTPYAEVGVGLDNILKCLRVDYVWRITHRHPGYKIDRSGVRIAFHVTF